MFTIIIISKDPYPPKEIKVMEQTTAIAVARLLIYDSSILSVDVYNKQGEKIIWFF